MTSSATLFGKLGFIEAAGRIVAIMPSRFMLAMNDERPSSAAERESAQGYFDSVLPAAIAQTTRVLSQIRDYFDHARLNVAPHEFSKIDKLTSLWEEYIALSVAVRDTVYKAEFGLHSCDVPLLHEAYGELRVHGPAINRFVMRVRAAA